MSTNAYCCSPDVWWVKQTNGTLLINRATGQSWVLVDAAALIWSWLALGYDAAQIARLLALTLSLSPQAARAAFDDLFADWQQAGILLSGDAPESTQTDPPAESSGHG